MCVCIENIYHHDHTRMKISFSMGTRHHRTPYKQTSFKHFACWPALLLLLLVCSIFVFFSEPIFSTPTFSPLRLLIIILHTHGCLNLIFLFFFSTSFFMNLASFLKIKICLPRCTYNIMVLYAFSPRQRWEAKYITLGGFVRKSCPVSK